MDLLGPYQDVLTPKEFVPDVVDWFLIDRWSSNRIMEENMPGMEVFFFFFFCIIRERSLFMAGGGTVQI